RAYYAAADDEDEAWEAADTQQEEEEYEDEEDEWAEEEDHDDDAAAFHQERVMRALPWHQLAHIPARPLDLPLPDWALGPRYTEFPVPVPIIAAEETLGSFATEYEHASLAEARGAATQLSKRLRDRETDLMLFEADHTHMRTWLSAAADYLERLAE